MNTCKHCKDTLFTEIYDTCMSCFEKNHAQANMEKTIEDYQKEINALQATVNGDGYNIKRLSEENEKLRNELQCWKNNGEVKSGVVQRQREILDKTLFQLPVGNITQHTYENIPSRVADLVKKEATSASLAAWVAEESLQSLEEAIKTHYDYYKGFAAKKHLSSIEMLDALLPLCVADFKENKSAHYKAALEEITKRPRKSETCRLIALQALGLLNDDECQPELLIEENLKLKMKIEDLQAVIDSTLLDRVFPDKVNTLMQCKDCGEYWDYHHEQHCKANV